MILYLTREPSVNHKDTIFKLKKHFTSTDMYGAVSKPDVEVLELTNDFEHNIAAITAIVSTYSNKGINLLASDTSCNFALRFYFEELQQIRLKKNCQLEFAIMHSMFDSIHLIDLFNVNLLDINVQKKLIPNNYPITVYLNKTSHFPVDVPTVEFIIDAKLAIESYESEFIEDELSVELLDKIRDNIYLPA